MSSRPRRKKLQAGPDDTLATDKLAAFGANLRAARRAAGIAQIELARLANITDCAHLSRIENGRINVTFRTMERLAAALKVKITDLIGTENGAA